MTTQAEEKPLDPTVQQLLSFQTVNYAANKSGVANVIYITTDKSYNSVNLQIMVNTSSVMLTPGTITDPNTIPPPNAGTVMYLDLSGLNLSGTLFSQLQFSADNWVFKLFPNDNAVGMTPTQNIPLSADASGGIPIQIEQLEIDQALSTPTVQLAMSYYNVKGITAEFFNFGVAIEPRPDVASGNLPDAIEIDVSTNTILCNYPNNSFQLEFSPASGTPLQVPAGPKTLFSVSFIYGGAGDKNGYGALTDTKDALNISCTRGDNADQWTPTFHTEAQSPYWTLQPPSGIPIVGTGIKAIVSFNFADIQTPYQPGLTQMLVSYSDVPGYQDGVFSIPLYKELPTLIDCFEASSMLVNINGDNKITLSWTVQNPKSISIPGFGPQTGNNLEVTVNATTTYTLQVTGSNGQFVEKSITIYAYRSFPSISVGSMGDGTAFQSLPLSITDQAHGMIYVSNSAAGQVYRVIQASRTVDRSTIFTGNIMSLTPDGQRFFVAQVSIPLPGNPTLTMYDTNNKLPPCQWNQQGPPPYSLAISPDSSKLYYLQRHGLITVSAFSVDETANTFAYQTDIQVGTSPQAYAFDGTGENLYVGNYDTANVSVINLTQNKVITTIPLQSNEPCAFALVGTTLFVACSGDNRVCVIDTSTNTALDPITAGNRPFSLTLDQNNMRLFVTNFQDNSVTVINTKTRKVENTINVGNGPSAAKITDSGNLMFVSNYCDKSLTVVDISNGEAIFVGTIILESTNGNPIDISTYPANNFYTDVFVAKEYFRSRNDSCPSPTATDANLNMSILSIQEKQSSAQSDIGPNEPPVKRSTPNQIGILKWLSWLAGWIRKVFSRITD